MLNGRDQVGTVVSLSGSKTRRSAGLSGSMTVVRGPACAWVASSARMHAMRRIIPLLALVAATTARAGDNTILHYWVQLGPGGAQQARAVVSGDACPIIATFKAYDGDGRIDVPMTPRAAKSADFPLVCEGIVPKDVNHA